MIDWSTISPQDFEKLCGELLELGGFRNIEWHGRGGADRGRDLVATKEDEPLGGTRRSRKWIVQCKRHLGRPIAKDELASFFTAVREHKPKAVLVIVTATLTSAVRDWLIAVRDDYPFEIFVWEERDLEREIKRYRGKLSFVPPIEPQKTEPRWFYQFGPLAQVYVCNEVEEVGLWVMNPGSRSEDIGRIEEFVDFIRHNEITFDDGQTESPDDDDEAG